MPPALLHIWPASGALGELRAALHPDRYLKRFYAALAFSCLLHAAIVFMPFFGAQPAVSGVPLRVAHRPGPARKLSVRFIAENATAAGAQPPPAPAVYEEPMPAPERSLAIDLLPLSAPAYYSAEQLTKRPQPTSDPSLQVPDSAPFAGSGTVVLKLWISELGKVDSVDVEASDVPEAVAVTAAAAFGKLLFVPGEINGRRVGATLRIEVKYEEPARGEGTRDDATGTPP